MNLKLKEPNTSFMTRILNYLMISGQKRKIEIAFLKTNKMIQKLKNKNHKIIFKLSILNGATMVQLKELKRKNKKIKREFPVVLSKKNRLFFSVKSIVVNLKSSKKKHLAFSLSQTIFQIAQKKNINLIKYNSDLQKTSILKKKYLNFRWLS